MATADSLEQFNALFSIYATGEKMNTASIKSYAPKARRDFIYQDKAPDHLDKSVLDGKPENAIKNKKRYILGRKLGDSPKVWHGNTRVSAGTEDEMEFWLPRGTNRFHFAGGSRFIHGGQCCRKSLSR